MFVVALALRQAKMSKAVAVRSFFTWWESFGDGSEHRGLNGNGRRRSGGRKEIFVTARNRNTRRGSRRTRARLPRCAYSRRLVARSRTRCGRPRAARNADTRAACRALDRGSRYRGARHASECFYCASGNILRNIASTMLYMTACLSTDGTAMRPAPGSGFATGMTRSFSGGSNGA